MQAGHGEVENIIRDVVNSTMSKEIISGFVESASNMVVSWAGDLLRESATGMVDAYKWYFLGILLALIVGSCGVCMTMGMIFYCCGGSRGGMAGVKEHPFERVD